MIGILCEGLFLGHITGIVLGMFLSLKFKMRM